jgi:hypothetical protein
MRSSDYQEGAKAREAFERIMTALFRVPKQTLKEKPKPKHKDEKKSDKD